MHQYMCLLVWASFYSIDPYYFFSSPIKIQSLHFNGSATFKKSIQKVAREEKKSICCTIRVHSFIEQNRNDKRESQNCDSFSDTFKLNSSHAPFINCYCWLLLSLSSSSSVFLLLLSLNRFFLRDRMQFFIS